MSVLVIAEHADGAVKPATLTTVGAATRLGGDLHILVVGSDVQAAAQAAAKIAGVSKVLVADAPHYAHGIAENVALQIERRIAYRRAMKKAVQTAMDFGAEGIKIRSSGRLNGAEISRSEWYREGKIPLHTLRTPIDYGFAEANTVYGKIGVKCWICRKEERPAEPPAAPAAPPPPPPEPAGV